MLARAVHLVGGGVGQHLGVVDRVQKVHELRVVAGDLHRQPVPRLEGVEDRPQLDLVLVDRAGLGHAALGVGVPRQARSRLGLVDLAH